MADFIDIADIARRTGLTARALRFYEARGLVSPLRTASGRRAYDAATLERLHQIVALKRAGLSLAQIEAVLTRKPIDLRRLIAAQLAVVEQQRAALAEMQVILSTTLSRIDRGEPIDAATFCSLIRTGDTIMTPDHWTAVTDRYFSAEEKAHWTAHMPANPDFDSAAYSARWTDLDARIEAALPLDPASDAAQAFLADWRALLAPFTAVATPEMMAGAGKLYDRIDEWQGDAKPPFSSAVWAFITAAGGATGEGGGR